MTRAMKQIWANISTKVSTKRWRWIAAGIVLTAAACSTVVTEVATLTAEQVIRSAKLPDAEAGDPEAQYDVGMTYCCTGGLPSTTYDNQRTTEWLCKAAAQNYAPAMAQLGDIYSGDLIDGIKLFRRAYIEIGKEDSQPAIAALWYERAISTGFDGASVALRDLMREMSAAQKIELITLRSSGPDALPCLWNDVYDESRLLRGARELRDSAATAGEQGVAGGSDAAATPVD